MSHNLSTFINCLNFSLLDVNTHDFRIQLNGSTQTSSPRSKQPRLSNVSTGLYNHSFDSDVATIIQNYGKLELCSNLCVENWLRNLETYSLKIYQDCEWLMSVIKLLLGDVFMRFYYKSEKESKFTTWGELRELLKNEYTRLDDQMMMLVSMEKTQFLEKILDYKNDKSTHKEKYKKQPISNYFKEKFSVMEAMYPHLRVDSANSDAVKIGVSLATCGDNQLIKSLKGHRLCRIKQFLSFCMVEDELAIDE